MARKKTLNNPKLISLTVETEDYIKLKNNVNNISEFIRNYITDYVNLGQNTLTNLKIERANKLEQLNNLKLEIDILNDKIKEVEAIQKENINNKNTIAELIEKIKDVSKNEFNNNGITKDRIKAIANNKINPRLLIKECNKQGIKIIKESERTNSTITEEKKGINKDGLTLIAKLFYRNYNAQSRYNNKEKFLNYNINDYKLLCNKKGINFIEFKNYILNQDK